MSARKSPLEFTRELLPNILTSALLSLLPEEALLEKKILRDKWQKEFFSSNRNYRLLMESEKMLSCDIDY